MEFVEKFREALKIPTFWTEGRQDGDAEAVLLRFQEFIVENFPAFHKAAERWALNPYSVIYRLQGGGKRSQDEAVLFLAHYDVVPAETEKWSTDPFGAELKDGFVYGRGSLDMKSILVCMLEAAEKLCLEGHRPDRDIWFAFGGDEERSGIMGAMEAVRWFEQRGQRFAWILDEGTPVAQGHIKGVDSPLALVSTEEKGYLSLNLAVEQKPGHASRPPKVQAAAVLARALCRLSKKPFPFRLSPAVRTFFRQVSSFVPGIQGFAMRHARALGPLFFKAAAGSPETESLLRTTVAMTMLTGSAADNVMPSQVNAVVNLRLLWPWTVEKATDYVRKAIGDKRVNVSVYRMASDPVATGGDYLNNGWPEIMDAMKEAWPGVPVLPFIMVATTDSRHFGKLAGNIFRFSPYKLDPVETGGIHGHDERISIENLERGLAFYCGLMRLL